MKKRRGYISVEAEVDVDVSDCLPEIDTEDLIEELKERDELPGVFEFNDQTSLRKAIGRLLGLHEWYLNDKQKYFERIEELF